MKAVRPIRVGARVRGRVRVGGGVVASGITVRVRVSVRVSIRVRVRDGETQQVGHRRRCSCLSDVGGHYIPWAHPGL